MTEQTKQILEEIKISRKKKIEDRKVNGLCIAHIYHGPGHQSKTWCEAKGVHTTHFATFGRFDDYAEWEEEETFSSRIW